MLEQEYTQEQAQAVIDSVNLDPAEWVAYEKRSEQERVAMGVVIIGRIARGQSLRVIERETGIPRATAARYRDLAYSKVVLPNVDDSRKLELDRIDAIIDILWPQIEQGDDKAISQYWKAVERRAKLLGTDRPIEISQTVTEISQQERELQDLIAQAQRDEAVRESELRGLDTQR